MAGRSDPPGGPSGDVPGSGDEEFRSTVFDESFVRSAQLEEYSARQRLEDHTSPVRSRVGQAAALGGGNLSKNGLAIAAVLLTAVLIALFLGNRGPYRAETPAALEPPPVGSLLPLAPAGEVPGGEPSELYADSAAAEFGIGSYGIPTPEPRRTAMFDRDQVAGALELAQRYVVASTLTPEVLAGTTAVPVRVLLRPEQQRQLDRSLTGRTGESAMTTWLVRFDSDEVRLTDEQVRMDGTFTVAEAGSRLEVTASHRVVYALRPAGDAQAPASLFIVHREVLLAFSEEDLRDSRAVLVNVETVAGPADCAVGQQHELRPLLAGESPARHGTDVDPYTLGEESVRPCAALMGS
jgi:hypothetical protein